MPKQYRIEVRTTDYWSIKFQHSAVATQGGALETLYSSAGWMEGYRFKRTQKKLRKRMELLGYTEVNNPTGDA